MTILKIASLLAFLAIPLQQSSSETAAPPTAPPTPSGEYALSHSYWLHSKLMMTSIFFLLVHVIQTLLKTSHILPLNDSVSLQFKDSILVQFHFDGQLMTVKARIEFIGDPPQSNCKNRYIPIYQFPRKALLRNTSVICDLSYWVDTSTHRQKLEVVLTNGENALDVKQVVIHIRVEVSASLPVQNYLYNIIMLKPKSLAGTAEPVAGATSINQGFVDRYRSNVTTPILLALIAVLLLTIFVVAIALFLVLKKAHERRQQFPVRDACTMETSF